MKNFASLSIVLLLAGCGAQQSPVTLQSVSNVKVEPDGSWMLPEAKKQDLLYVSNSDKVTVYTYPANKFVGEIKGLFNSVGLCVDGKGNVYVTNENPVAVYEFRHGGSKPIATFFTRHVGAVGCAVDPTTGNLAVSGNTQYVNIFRSGNAKPRVVKDEAMFYNQFCTYDDEGNLFVNGLASPSNGTPRLAELPSAGHRFNKISLSTYMYPEGGIQWNDGQLTTLSYTERGDKARLVRFAIAGNDGTKTGSTPLNKPANLVSQYFILKGRVIVPNLYDSDSTNPAVLFYKYPRGGNATMQLTDGITAPFGAVVSPAQ